jgi:hypothetical protein
MSRFSINLSMIWLYTVMVLTLLDWGSDIRSTNVVTAFVSQPQSIGRRNDKTNSIAVPYHFYRTTITSSTKTATTLLERRWNFNEGQGPFGLKKNAETWNGRVAQVCQFLPSCIYRVP